MRNVFDPKSQNGDNEARLIAGIERLSTVFKSVLQDTAKENKLTPLQTQLLIFIDQHTADLCTVTSLSLEFSVTKATMSDSLRALSSRGFVNKIKNHNDSRSFHFTISKSSQAMVSDLNKFGENLIQKITTLKSKDKQQLSILTLKLINAFQQADIIPGRMCYSCRFFEQQKDQDYCALLKVALNDNTIRLDCPDHAIKR